MKNVLLFGRVGRESLPASLRQSYQVLTLRFSPDASSGDFNTDARRLQGLLGRSWSVRAFDLLNVVCALRAADRFYPSGGRYHMQRNFPLAVGVTESARWQLLSASLAQAVRSLSGDTLEFHPIQLPKIPPAALPLPGVETHGLSPFDGKPPDCVCLYSGGADSFAGAAYLLSHGRRPIFVSHSVGPISGLQRRLFDDLRARFPALDPRQLVQLRSYPNTTKMKREAGGRKLYWKNRDDLQRLRSIFFFSLAAIVAQSFDIKEIFMCENGLIGAAIIFSPRDDNPSTTRPAEPHYLRAVEHFLQRALEYPELRIRNPFQYMTKGEVLAYADRLGLRDSLYRTVSCWRSGNRGVKNCGQCVPCLFRQLAFDEAGLPSPPSAYSYQHPIPRRNWRAWNSRELERLEDIREYCRRVVQGGTCWLIENELAVVDAIDVTGGPLRRTSQEPAKRESRDKLAPCKMSQVILRFAHATLTRLP
jgi:7-cyano-7-deazaguanine synthase in queuosine biosynthesis